MSQESQDVLAVLGNISFLVTLQRSGGAALMNVPIISDSEFPSRRANWTNAVRPPLPQRNPPPLAQKHAFVKPSEPTTGVGSVGMVQAAGAAVQVQ